MSEHQPEDQNEALLRVTTSEGEYDIYAEHMKIFTYWGQNSMFDNMFINHPDCSNSLLIWRYDTGTGKEMEDFEATKWRAIKLGSVALLNLDAETDYLAIDRELYVEQSLGDLDSPNRFDKEEDTE